jgi:hypothetical protein
VWHVLVLVLQKFYCPRTKLFVNQAFLRKKKGSRFLAISVGTNPKTLIPLSLKVATPGFFLVHMYLMKVLIKYHCPKLKKFVPAGFLGNRIKV